MTVLAKLSNIMSRDLGYNAEGKKAFLSTARSALNQVAKELELPKGSFKISKNESGIACSGDVRLSHDKFEMSIKQTCMGRDHDVLYRTRDGRNSGTNNFCSVVNMADDRVLNRIRNWLEA